MGKVVEKVVAEQLSQYCEKYSKLKVFLDKPRRGNPKVAITYSGKIEQKWKKQGA